MKSIVIYGVTRSADWISFYTAIHNCTCVNYSTENQTSLVTDWFVLCIEWWLVAVSDGNQTIPSVPQLNTSPRGDKIVNIPTHSDQHRIGYPYFQIHTVRKHFVCGLNGGWVHRSLHAAWVFHHGHIILPRSISICWAWFPFPSFVLHAHWVRALRCSEPFPCESKRIREAKERMKQWSPKFVLFIASFSLVNFSQDGLFDSLDSTLTNHNISRSIQLDTTVKWFFLKLPKTQYMLSLLLRYCYHFSWRIVFWGKLSLVSIPEFFTSSSSWDS